MSTKLSVLSNTHTNNFNDQEVAQKINQAWGEASLQPEFHGVEIYAVYHNYEGNYANDYDLSICVEDQVEGKEVVEISDETKYQVFDAEPVENGVFQTWQSIWGQEAEGKLNRAYAVDYEHYLSDGRIKIYISVK